MDSKAFVTGIQQRLEPLAPVMVPGIIQKQLADLGISEDNMTPDNAREFIRKMDEALEMFIGSKGKMIVHEIMMKELRRTAPEYFVEPSLT